MATRKRKKKTSQIGQSGFGISMFVVDLLEKNEQSHLTDPELAELLRLEFGSDKQYLRNISHLRCLYNRGIFSRGRPPKKPSIRYDENGRVMAKGQRYRNKPKNGDAAITIKLSEVESNKIGDVALRLGVNVDDYVKQTLMEATERVSDRFAERLAMRKASISHRLKRSIE